MPLITPVGVAGGNLCARATAAHLFNISCKLLELNAQCGLLHPNGPANSHKFIRHKPPIGARWRAVRGPRMTPQTSPTLVLVVDDEALILQLLEVSLEEGGYTVVSVGSSVEATAKLDQKAADFRAVVTDVNLGRSSPTGWDVARHARELIPDIPIVYMTGDSAAEWTSNGVPHSILVPKPFAPAQIVTAVSQLINASGLTLS